MTGDWQAVWERKGAQPLGDQVDLGALLRADGYDTGHGDVGVAAWRDYVARVLGRFGAEPGHSVYDVGCGAGAFLVPARDEGLRVGGADYSASMVALAKQALPDGDFDVCDASALAPTPTFDFVVSSAVFLYFDGLDHARRVIAAMLAKARRGIAILDIPDVAQREAALEMRYAAAGGKHEYQARYQGLDQQYYDRSWFAEALAAAGATDVEVRDQDLVGYSNGAYRFNVWALSGR